MAALLVQFLEPYTGRVYDPCCGSGDIFIQLQQFVAAHKDHATTPDLAIRGQEADTSAWRLAKMNLAIHEMDVDALGDEWADVFEVDKHPEHRADTILTRPPFNLHPWNRRWEDDRWRFGLPPASNANFAYLQHVISKMSDRGTAGVVLPQKSLSSQKQIRKAIVDADMVSCVVALPPGLFPTSACLWFLDRNKGPHGGSGLTDRRGDVLFLDARTMGERPGRTELSTEELATLAHTFHAWRGTASANMKKLEYKDVPGFAYSAKLREIAKRNYVLTPVQYVGTSEVEKSLDSAALDEKITRLTNELYAHFDESSRLEGVVREQLGRIESSS